MAKENTTKKSKKLESSLKATSWNELSSPETGTATGPGEDKSVGAGRSLLAKSSGKPLGSNQNYRNTTRSKMPSAASLLAQLTEHNDFFDMVVDIIPSSIYLAGNPANADENEALENKYYKKNNDAQSKERRRAQAKIEKRNKFHPQLAEGTVQRKTRVEQTHNEVQHAIPLSEPAQAGTKRRVSMDSSIVNEIKRKALPGPSATAPKKIVSPISSNTSQQAPNTQESEHNMKHSNDAAEMTPSNENPADKHTTATTGNASTKQSRIEALRERLHAKIAELKQRSSSKKRKEGDVSGEGENPDHSSKKRQRREEKKVLAKQLKKKVGNTPATSNAVFSNMPNSSSSRHLDDPLSDLSKLDFGRLAGFDNMAQASSLSNYQQANKALANLSKPKNLQKMLADALANKEKLQALQQSASSQDQQKATNITWSQTFKEADGQKHVSQQQDPKKIAKAIQRKAVKKQKSQKVSSHREISWSLRQHLNLTLLHLFFPYRIQAWQSRIEQTAASQSERQKIRNHNLNARKQGGKTGASLSKKRIATESGGEKKRPGNRAGFEGRKPDFLNSPAGGGKANKKPASATGKHH
jgi:60S ribosome biogenesis protein Rrp14/Surfeit locus protein 6